MPKVVRWQVAVCRAQFEPEELAAVVQILSGHPKFCRGIIQIIQPRQQMGMRAVKSPVFYKEFTSMLMSLIHRFANVDAACQLRADSGIDDRKLARFQAAGTIKAYAVAGKFSASRMPEIDPDKPCA